MVDTTKGKLEGRWRKKGFDNFVTLVDNDVSKQEGKFSKFQKRGKKYFGLQNWVYYTIISIISLKIDCFLCMCGEQVLPDSIAGLPKLQRLDISSNLLESLPDSIGLLVNLKVVIVSGNKLNMLPETITGCR